MVVPMTCPNCGSPTSQQARWCESCGHSLERAVEDDIPITAGPRVPSRLLAIAGAVLICIAIATGGLSSIIATLEGEFMEIDRSLTLNGLRLIGERVSKVDSHR